ncbi:MAG: histidine phosphatase family protein [Actinomycetes bacterium]
MDVARVPSAEHATRVLLVRHGESVANTRPHIIGGRSNHSPLTSTGQQQATRLGRGLAACGYQPEVVYSSPAVRTVQTAESAMAAMGFQARVQLDDRLQELDQGQWTGRLRENAYTPESALLIAAHGVDFAAPGGESMRAVGLRMLQWLKSVEDEHPNVQVLVFAHGMATRCLAGLIGQWNQDRIRHTDTPNTSLTRFTITGGQPVIDFLGQPIEAVTELLSDQPGSRVDLR